MAMLEARNLDVILNGRVILNKINIRAEKQQVVGIIGPNGSGKSTLLKCILPDT